MRSPFQGLWLKKVIPQGGCLPGLPSAFSMHGVKLLFPRTWKGHCLECRSSPLGVSVRPGLLRTTGSSLQLDPQGQTADPCWLPHKLCPLLSKP